ncbi:type IV toxin-antitoxin system AbiEi family antitoxin domain-containing protein [Natranaeroarchaeum sulfidigenes]|uniref:Transcriptional regulator containing HTH domain,ArsR family n=1 Tax=Natranaeroarchaeum sulfidigenes TaxID=2784880 RepID=A0A897MU86_9EURY|nr:type IV toxin-antitoxin system AbiEi family antitoxin domain-containing protein [Natranaeroarchaeum sulfidigenes]QSG04072.1 Transcriptional regulator containing HTH domain,ArsR family [Natranaeroarchaeum sulfidigenes]
MVNESYEPSPAEEEIMDLLQEGRNAGEPWGYTTPAHVREHIGIEEGNESFHLRQLTSAGWIEKVSRGFYRFVEDPREV